MMQFQQISSISKAEATAAFESGDATQICNALVSIACCENDWRWAQDKCLAFLVSSAPEISGLAATCLGHIARIHKLIDKDRVVAALRKQLEHPDIAGRIEDALEDIEKFACD